MMKINSILSVFAPKDIKFCPLLEETASVLVQVGTLLDELFSSDDKEKIKELCRLIKKVKTQNFDLILLREKDHQNLQFCVGKG